jgi:hypothetical protein
MHHRELVSERDDVQVHRGARPDHESKRVKQRNDEGCHEERLEERPQPQVAQGVLLLSVAIGERRRGPCFRLRNSVVDRLSVADGPSPRGLRLGLALFSNRRPAFFLSRSNRRPTRSGNALALHSPFWLGGL